MRRDDFSGVRRLAAESLQGRAVIGAWRLASQAWQDSRVRAIAERTSTTLKQTSTDDRTRVVALAVAIGAAINAAGRAVTPPYSAPAIPIGFLIAAVIVAAAVAGAPAIFGAAWRESRIARSKQR